MSMKKYKVKFVEANGEEYIFEFLTDRIDWSIDQYKRNRQILSHEIIKEDVDKSKGMLFG